MNEETIRQLVRAAVLRELGGADSRLLITEDDLKDIAPGGYLRVPPGAMVTPLAREAALMRRIELVSRDVPLPEIANDHPQAPVIAIGADHGGYPLKEVLKAFLKSKNYTILDLGTHSQEAVDYPDFAHTVALAVSEGQAWRGILIDGAGIGSCMAANKVPGIRAALCYDQSSAINSREHNDANILTLGAGLIGENLAKQIVDTWLATEFGGGRHARRVNKIMQIERRYLKKQRAAD
jgi:ribose 5-phosphate isomerase B